MASIWKHPESQYWIACFRDANGRQRRVSTKVTDRKEAQHIAEQYEKASRTQRTLRQTRKAIERLHEEIDREAIAQKSLRTYAQQWLGAKKSEVHPRTYDSYSGGLSQLLNYLGPRADVRIARASKRPGGRRSCPVPGLSRCHKSPLQRRHRQPQERLGRSLLDCLNHSLSSLQITSGIARAHDAIRLRGSRHTSRFFGD